jgi:hypothetical protein
VGGEHGDGWDSEHAAALGVFFSGVFVEEKKETR